MFANYHKKQERKKAAVSCRVTVPCLKAGGSIHILPFMGIKQIKGNVDLLVAEVGTTLQIANEC